MCVIGHIRGINDIQDLYENGDITRPQVIKYIRRLR